MKHTENLVEIWMIALEDRSVKSSEYLSNQNQVLKTEEILTQWRLMRGTVELQHPQ